MTSEPLILVSFLVNIIVAIIFLVLGFKINRPKLRIDGTGSGGRPAGPEHNHIGIRNVPTFIGFKVPRQTAEITNSHLKEQQNGRIHALPRNWQTPDEAVTSRETKIQAGDYSYLQLFLLYPNKIEYCVCGGDINTIPENAHSFTDERKLFTLKLRDKIGREYSFDLVVSIHQNGLIISHAITFSERLRHLRKGMSYFKAAFTFKKYH